MKFNEPFCVVFAGAFLATVTLVGLAKDANARARRIHSSACHSYFDSDDATFNGQQVTAGSTVFQNFINPLDGNMTCHAPSDSYFAHSSTVTLNVHGNHTSGSEMWARACAISYYSIDEACGSSSDFASGYGGAYGLDVSAWNGNGAWMPYVKVRMFPGDQLFGFYMAY